MPRPDPFRGTRKDDLDDYLKDKINYFGPGKKGFFRVYNSKLKGYMYFVGIKVRGLYKFSCFYWKKHWYRNEVRPGTYSNGTVDPARIKVYPAGKTTQKKLLYSLWEQNWVKLY